MPRHNVAIELDLMQAKEAREEAINKGNHWAAWDANVAIMRLETERRAKEWQTPNAF